MMTLAGLDQSFAELRRARWDSGEEDPDHVHHYQPEPRVDKSRILSRSWEEA